MRALVQPDRVHRDLYIDPELFELEQEHFFANTWNYVGHDEPDAEARATTSRNEIAGRPLIVVRHSDGTVRVLMNRCAHKGSRLVSAPCGNTGKFFRCPYHAWTFKTDGSLLAIPLKNGYEGTRLHECEAAKGLAHGAATCALYRGFIFAKLNDVGPGLRGVLRRLADARSTTWPTARPRASSRSPAAACASCTSATGRCSSRT